MSANRRRCFVPAFNGLEDRSLTTTFEPIIAPPSLIGDPVIGLPGPLPVPPPPIETDGPILPYQPAPLPPPTYIAV
jgi:hypothetical protein